MSDMPGRRPIGFTKTDGELGRSCGHGGFQCDYCGFGYCGAMLERHRIDCTKERPRPRLTDYAGTSPRRRPPPEVPNG